MVKLLNLLPIFDTVLILGRSSSAIQSRACCSLSANITYRLVGFAFSTGGVLVLERVASLSLALALVPFVPDGVPGLSPTVDVVGTAVEEGWGVNGLFCVTGGTGEAAAGGPC